MSTSIRSNATMFFMLMITAIIAHAAPYCAVFSYGKQCYYYDWKSCQQAAGSQGACVINQEEAKAPSGAAPFCLVTSYGTQCHYYDAQSCRQAAASANAVCAINPNR
jgi:hypothetical protein